MRTLITTAVGAVALATAFIGNVSAQTYYSDVPHVNNLALQDQLEQDASKPAIERAPLGVVISPGDQTPSTANAATDAPQRAQAASDNERFLRRVRYSAFVRDRSASGAEAAGTAGSSNTAAALGRPGQGAS